MATLPIQGIRDDILSVLRSSNRLVLTAPTGSGKTTQVPQFLLQADLLPVEHRQIVVLQPRRLAARLVARRVAEEMGSKVGDVVGYQTRHDSQVSKQTVIRFLTEGLFLRQMQSDPVLAGVGAVILDEFHERSLASDTALALVKQLQESRRHDLRLIVMSATLETKRVSEYLQCPTLETHGRAYPVQMRYLQRPSDANPWELAADALDDILDADSDGDVLVFMPGAYEIRRTIELCREHARMGQELAIYALHSEMPVREQDAAVGPSEHRKVIVSTNVAETSITIPGIRHVVDSGLARVNRFDPRRGINVLQVEEISRSSADQRAGRAGRTAPGTCTRLWTEAEHRRRAAHETPEIQRLDLAEVLLQLFAMGVTEPEQFPWLQAPSELALAQAKHALRTLGALTASGELTSTGRQMSRLPMHPRLSRMLIEAEKRNCLARACLWAAIISERNILIRGAKHPFADDLGEGIGSDFRVLENALDAARRVEFDPVRCERMGVHGLACRELDKTRQLYMDVTGAKSGRQGVAAEVIKCLLVAFPDHLAIRRSESNLACALVGQRRGNLDAASVAKRVGLVLPVEIQEIGVGTGLKTVLSLVTEIEPDWLREVHGDRVVHRREAILNPDTLVVESVDRDLFDDLVIEESARHDPDPVAAAEILAEEIFRGRLKLERWDESVDQWIDRVRCVAEWFPERNLITYSEDDRRVVLSEICAGATRYSQIKDRPCLQYVKDALSWEDQRFVEKMAPERIELPRGWKMRIEYTPGQSPRGRAKIQDFYGMAQSPKVAGGRQRVVLEILAPNMRPIQLTNDLANFWKNLYPTVKKELSRRYPRHEWR